MRCKAEIGDARGRIDAASALFHLRSRVARQSFDALASDWADARGRRFGSLHVQPQTEMIESGSALWGEAAKSLADAGKSAEGAEVSPRQAYAAAEEFGAEARDLSRFLRTAEELATFATAESVRVTHESQSLLAAVASAAYDPGW